MKRPVLFSDLDDTLFQTVNRMTGGLKQNEDAVKNGAKLVCHARNGRDSWMTPAQDCLFQWLNDTTRLIPVTARSTESLSRCVLPFRDYRIAGNGAVILDSDGSIDRNWMERTRGIVKPLMEIMFEFENFISGYDNRNRFRHWMVKEQDSLPVYYQIKSNGPESWLDELRQQLIILADGMFLMHENGNNISLIPHDISKRAAVEYLLDEIDILDIPVWGMGDSLTDLPFMRACEMMVIPTGSQIHRGFEGQKNFRPEQE